MAQSQVHQYTAGSRNAGNYLTSGDPYITGSGGVMHTMAQAGDAGSGSATAYHTDGAGTAAAPAEVRVNFPYLTKKILVYASGSGTHLLRVHFVSLYDPDGTGALSGRVDAGHHFIELDADEDYWEFNIKTDRIYLSTPNTTTGFKLYAELCGTPTGSMYSLTGSGISQ